MRHRRMTGLLKVLLDGTEKPAKVIAAELGMSYSALMNQLNPDIPNAKFGVDDLAAFCMALDTVAPLEYFAAQLGYRITPLSGAKPDKDTLEEELLDTYPALLALHNLRGRKFTDEEIARLSSAAHQEIDEDVAALKANAQGSGGLGVIKGGR